MKRAKPATTAAKAHMARIKAMPCICCELLENDQRHPTDVHHIREDREGRNDFLTLPLCWSCHQGIFGVHGTRHFLKLLKTSEYGLLAKVIERL